MKFGDKIPFESATEVPGVGNSANAAVSLARLGLKTGLIAHVGKGANGQKCLESLRHNNVSTAHIYEHNLPTNYHYVLWFEDERTILVKHEGFPYSLPNIAPNPKWVYLSSLSHNSEEYHKEILEWLNQEPDIKLCFQPGTFQFALGVEKLGGLYKRADVLAVNVEEAQRILGLKEVGFTDINGIKNLFVELAKLGPKIILITDGPSGAYMHIPHYESRDMQKSTAFWYMPIYPDPKPPMERTGCGDAFTSTFIAALILGKLPTEALEWAPVNPMSVVQDIGAQRGLLDLQTLEDLLKKRPDHYHAKPI
jgi:sugar/nucleoside kinase (ribokinase family)